MIKNTVFSMESKKMEEYRIEGDTIIFEPEFNESLDNFEFPNGITKITFYETNIYHSMFRQLVNNLPDSITHLTFGHCFNKPIDKFPNSITHLTFRECFDQPIDNLPNSITHLTFGECFNQLVNNLPNSITHLSFGHCFNKPVDNLPNSITHLTFGTCFNQSIDNLPNNLVLLGFSCITENNKIQLLYPKYNYTIPKHVKPKYLFVPCIFGKKCIRLETVLIHNLTEILTDEPTIFTW